MSNLFTKGNQGEQILPLQITKVTVKKKYGTFTQDKKYDVYYVNATNDCFLVKDDDDDPIWVDFEECKIV